MLITSRHYAAPETLGWSFDQALESYSPAQWTLSEPAQGWTWVFCLRDSQPNSRRASWLLLADMVIKYMRRDINGRANCWAKTNHPWINSKIFSPSNSVLINQAKSETGQSLLKSLSWWSFRRSSVVNKPDEHPWGRGFDAWPCSTC